MITITLKREKPTKNTVRYIATEDDSRPAVAAIYVPNYTLDELGHPDELVFEVRAANHLAIAA